MELIKKAEGISPYAVECGANGRCDGQCSCKSQCNNKCETQCVGDFCWTIRIG